MVNCKKKIGCKLKKVFYVLFMHIFHYYDFLSFNKIISFHAILNLPLFPILFTEKRKVPKF